MSVEGSDPRAEIEKSQKVSDSHRNDVSPLTQGLRYRAACDIREQSRRPYNLYCVGGDVKPCSINQS